MKYIIFFTVFISPAILFGQHEDVRLKNFNLDKGLAIEGYDPVSYFQGKPSEGKKSHSFVHRGVAYYFSSAANRSAFIDHPEKYEPAYGGWCAYAMGKNGDKVKVDPETFKIVNERVFLFYNFWGNNTLADWNENEPQLKSSADKQWKKYVGH
jgi:YHS domain-containing protein